MRSRWLVLGLTLGLFAWCFAAVLWRSELFAFRDAADFYQPLFQFTRSQWLAGRVPLWNPYENLGMPLAGNATSSVFYPGTLVFLLPCDYAWAYKIYILAHVLLAAATSYRAARHFGSSVEAAGLAALCYAFGGNVLYQYSNVVFLVGAAWLPAAVEAADRMLVGRSLRAAFALGVILALVTLGGDPQAAYHAGLLAATYALGLWWRERSRVGRAQRAPPRESVEETVTLAPVPRAACPPVLAGHGQTSCPWHPGAVPTTRDAIIRSRPALLAAAAVVAFVLAAVAVLPSIEFTAHSERSATRVARSIYEIPGCLRYPDAGTRMVRGLKARVDPGSHEEHVYQFSVGPWRLVEYLWPNFSGRQFPENRRWLDILPWEARIWVPSFYMGLLPLVLAIVRLRLWGSRKREREGLECFRTRWLSWIVLLSVVASFGWYGLGCLESLRVEILGRGSPVVDPPFGGLYWLMTVLLPGYIQFRYPAKLLSVAALGLSLLAAFGWDQVLSVNPRRVRRVLLGFGAISLLGAAVAMGLRPFWNGWFAQAEPNPLFGPLDAVGAANDVLRSLLHAAILSGLLAWLVKRRAENGWRARSAAMGVVFRPAAPFVPQGVSPQFRVATAALLLLTAVDLAVANGWMVATAPQRLWRDPPQLAAAINAQEELRGDGPFRVFRNADWLPAAWQSSRSPQRLAESVAWDRATLWPRHNLPAAICLAEVYGTMVCHDYRSLLGSAADAELARQHAAMPSEPGLKLPEGRPVLDLLGAKYLVLSGSDSLADAVRLPLPRAGETAVLEDVSFYYNSRHFARAWIVHEVTSLPPLVGDDLDTVRRRSDEVLADHDGRPRDFRREAVVETVEGAKKAQGLQPLGLVDVATKSESCHVTHYEPDRVVIDVRLARPGLVVLSDQYYPGWRLTVETAGQPPREMPILRTNRVMRGVWLSPGVHRLTYEYRPAMFYWGAMLSGLGWLIVSGLIPLAHRHRPKVGRERCVAAVVASE